MFFLIQENLREIEELTKQNDQLKRLQTRCNELSMEKIQYEKRIEEISKHPIMTCVNLQTVNNSFPSPPIIIIFFFRIQLMMIRKSNKSKMNSMIIN